MNRSNVLRLLKEKKGSDCIEPQVDGAKKTQREKTTDDTTLNLEQNFQGVKATHEQLEVAVDSYSSSSSSSPTLSSSSPTSSSTVVGKGQRNIYLDHDNTEEWDAWDPMGDDYRSALNTLALDPMADPLAAITGTKRPLDGTKIGNVTICDRYLKYGECADGEYCGRLHIDSETKDRIWALQNTYESNRHRICVNFTDLSPSEIKPDPNSLLLISVTQFKSPQDFYFVAPFGTMNFSQHTLKDIQFYVVRVTRTSIFKTKLQKCHEQLAALFDHEYRIDNLNDYIYLGQIVACKLKDGRFRRAMVIDIPSFVDELDYTLFLIDVGIKVRLPRELIYDIKAHCISEPPMAVNCRLKIRPDESSEGWSNQALSYFEATVRGKDYWLCKVLDYDHHSSQCTVDLHDPVTRSSLSDLMIKNGASERCRN